MYIVVTAEVSHKRGWLKDLAPENTARAESSSPRALMSSALYFSRVERAMHAGARTKAGSTVARARSLMSVTALVTQSRMWP